MATRAKKILITSVSHEEAEQAMATFAKCNTQLKGIEAKMEEEKQQIDNKFLGEVARLRSTLEEQLNLLQVYGQHSKDQWKGKSLELVHGKIGFRTGNPKLVKDKKFTWDGRILLCGGQCRRAVRGVFDPPVTGFFRYLGQ